MFLIAFFCQLNSLQAQLPSGYTEPKNKISIDVFTGAIGRIPLTSELGFIYTRNLKPRLDLSGKLAYSGPNLFLMNLESDTGTRLRAEIAIKGGALGSTLQYVLNPNGRRQWYTGVELNYTYTYMNDKQDRSLHASLTKFTTALVLGYRVDHFIEGVELDIFAGLGVGFRSYRWERQQLRSVNAATGQVVNGAWGVGWGLQLEPSVSYAIPIGIRLGHWF